MIKYISNLLKPLIVAFIFGGLAPLIASQQLPVLKDVDENGTKIRCELVSAAASKPKKPMKLLCLPAIGKTKLLPLVQNAKVDFEDPKNESAAARVVQPNASQMIQAGDHKVLKEGRPFNDVMRLVSHAKKGFVYNRPENTVDRTAQAHEIMRPFTNQNNGIRSVLWSNDGARLIAQMADNSLTIGDLKTRRFSCLLQGGVTDLCGDKATVLSPNGKTLVTRHYDGSSVTRPSLVLRFWKIEEILATASNPHPYLSQSGSQVSWSNNSKYCAMPVGNFGIAVFEAETGKTLWFSGEKRNECGFVWSQDDRFILTYDNKFLEDGDTLSEIYQYDASNGKIVEIWQALDKSKIKDIKALEEGFNTFWATK